MPLFKRKSRGSDLATPRSPRKFSISSPVAIERVSDTSTPHTPALRNTPCFSGPRDVPLDNVPYSGGMPHATSSMMLLAASANEPRIQGSRSFFDLRTSSSGSESARDGISPSVSLPQFRSNAKKARRSVAFDSSSMQSSQRTIGSNNRGSRASLPSIKPSRALVNRLTTNVPSNPIRFPHPRESVALFTLNRVLRTETKSCRITDFIDWEDGTFSALLHKDENEDTGRRRKSMWDGEEEEMTLADCFRDKMEFGDKAQPSIWRVERNERLNKRKADREELRRNPRLFGAHLSDLPDAALVDVMIAGYIHEVPSVVAACINQLMRAPAYMPDLISTHPDRRVLCELAAQLDDVSEFGAPQRYTRACELLATVAPHNAFSLLATYLAALPHTLIPHPCVDALWAWCVSPSIIRHENKTKYQDLMHASGNDSGSDSDSDESHRHLQQRRRVDPSTFRVQIRIARYVLLLLSPLQFSILLHYMNMVSMMLYPEGDQDHKDGDPRDNGDMLRDVCKRLGGTIVGGKNWRRRGNIWDRRLVEAGAGRDDQELDEDSREITIMMWLVYHWGRIASDFEADEELDRVAQSRISERQRAEQRGRSSCESLTSGSTAASSSSSLESTHAPIVAPFNARDSRKPPKKIDLPQIGELALGDDISPDIFDYYLNGGDSSKDKKVAKIEPPGDESDASSYSASSGEYFAYQAARQRPKAAPTPEDDKLREKLERAEAERDEAKRMLEAMRSIMRNART